MVFKEDPQSMLLGEHFSQTYSLDYLIQFAEAQAEQENSNIALDQTVADKVSHLLHSPNFKLVYPRIFMGPDIDMTIPSTQQVIHLLRGSDFAADRLMHLEDVKLTEMLAKYIDYFGGRLMTGRDYFLDRLREGATLLATLEIPNDLSQGDLSNLTAHYLSKGVFDHTREGNWYKCSILLYAGAKVMANRLDYPIENKQSGWAKDWYS